MLHPRILANWLSQFCSAYFAAVIALRAVAFEDPQNVADAGLSAHWRKESCLPPQMPSGFGVQGLVFSV